MNACPICALQANVASESGYYKVHCNRCGDFMLDRHESDLPAKWMGDHHSDRRMAASHWIRRMQGSRGELPLVSAAQLRIFWNQPLPNPQRQADLLLLCLGDANLPMDQYVGKRSEGFCAEIGTRDDPRTGIHAGLNLVMKHLRDKHLIEHNSHPAAPNIELRLTFEGWAAYEALRRETVDSKTAFMAMSYGNPIVGKVVSEYFVPAVSETGFQLYRLDDRPKSGLIDNRMRVEIRAAKFLICDLTDENRGAYWESGFAEGAQKPVIYTCEKSKFDAARTHFDTEHLFTVLWSESDPTKAADELKAAIRNEFPGIAIPPDLSKRT
jgi:hypothetical protein